MKDLRASILLLRSAIKEAKHHRTGAKERRDFVVFFIQSAEHQARRRGQYQYAWMARSLLRDVVRATTIKGGVESLLQTLELRLAESEDPHSNTGPTESDEMPVSVETAIRKRWG